MNPAFTTLKEKKLIIFDDDAYIAIHQGADLGAEFLAEFINKGFSNGLSRFERSAVFKKFCVPFFTQSLASVFSKLKKQIGEKLVSKNYDIVEQI